MRSKAVLASLMVQRRPYHGGQWPRGSPPCRRRRSDTSVAYEFDSEIILCWKCLKTQVLSWLTVRDGFRYWLIRTR
jgi:hypothetical protein